MIKKIIVLFILLAFIPGCSSFDYPAEGAPADTQADDAPAEDAPAEDAPAADAPAFSSSDDTIDKYLSAAEKPLTLATRLPREFNPLLNTDESVDKILRLIFEPLAALDGSLKPEGRVADAFEFAPDGLSARVTLKANIVWSDGTPVTAGDVVYSLDVIKSAGDDSLYKECAENVKSYEVADDLTLIITFDNVYGAQAYRLCFPVIPRHYYETLEDDGVTPALPLGGGMYVMESYSVAKGIKLTANPLYFGQKPQIQTVSVIVTGDMETSLYAFGAGVIDCVDASVLEFGRLGGGDANIAEYTTGLYEFIGFNFDSAAFSDPRVRRAVAHCVDVDGIIESVYIGQAERAASPIGRSSWLYEPDTAVYEPDTKKAAELLDEAGFTASAGGVRTRRTGGSEAVLRLTLLVNDENFERQKIAQTLGDNLKKLNVEINIVSKPFFEYEDMINAGQYDMFVGGFVMPAAPDVAFAFTGENVFHYKNDDMDGHIALLENAVNESVFKSAAGELQKFFAEDLPCVSLVFRKSAVIASKRITGDLNPAPGAPYANLNGWALAG
jgi:peptide/nickel transport system substrate-binding protein